MKTNIRFSIYWLYLIGYILITLVSSCTKDSDGNLKQDIIGDKLNKVCTEWGQTQEYINSYMSEYNYVNSNCTDISIFKGKGDITISYQFYDNSLIATALIFPSSSNELNIDELLSCADFIGELNGAKIYQNMRDNKMYSVWEELPVNNSYSSIGIAPIDSEIFSDLGPNIEVSDNIEVDGFKANFSGNISNIEGNAKAGILYGTKADLSINGDSIRTITASNGQFEIEINGLIDHATYYYKPFVLVGEFYYFGEAGSFKTDDIFYSIQGKDFKMVKVEGEGLQPFSIMQTEIICDTEILFGNTSIGSLPTHDRYAVSQNSMRKFIENLREKTGLHFRIPTIEEWQYAANGGDLESQFIYSGGDDINEVAWYSNNSDRKPHEVALKKCNALGLYDMSGNYREICLNTSSNNEFSVDGLQLGGSWKDQSSECTIKSYFTGSVNGLIPNTSAKELGNYDARYVTVRLVYSR